jgi:hypothetical protein
MTPIQARAINSRQSIRAGFTGSCWVLLRSIYNTKVIDPVEECRNDVKKRALPTSRGAYEKVIRGLSSGYRCLPDAASAG